MAGVVVLEEQHTLLGGAQENGAAVLLLATGFGIVHQRAIPRHVRALDDRRLVVDPLLGIRTGELVGVDVVHRLREDPVQKLLLATGQTAVARMRPARRRRATRLEPDTVPLAKAAEGRILSDH